MSGVRFDVYEAKDGWRWRAIAGNNRIVADSAESYDSNYNVNRALRTFRHDVAEEYVAELGELFAETPGAPEEPFDQEKEKQHAER